MRLQAFSLKWISAYPCYSVKYGCQGCINKFCLCWSPISTRYRRKQRKSETCTLLHSSLCPSQWHCCFLSSSLFSPGALPESSGRCPQLKGTRQQSEALQETTGTLGIVQSQKVGRENVQWGGSQTTRNYKLKLRKKTLQTKWHLFHMSPMPQAPPLRTNSTAMKQVDDSPGPKSFCPSGDGKRTLIGRINTLMIMESQITITEL